MSGETKPCFNISPCNLHLYGWRIANLLFSWRLYQLMKLTPIAKIWLHSWFLFSSLVLRCRTLLPPVNGFFAGDCDSTYGSSCLMGCDPGYNMIGSENLTCLREPGHITGNWDGSVPFCKGAIRILNIVLLWWKFPRIYAIISETA